MPTDPRPGPRDPRVSGIALAPVDAQKLDEAIAALEDHASELRICIRSIERQMQEIRRRAGLEVKGG